MFIHMIKLGIIEIFLIWKMFKLHKLTSMVHAVTHRIQIISDEASAEIFYLCQV